MLFSKGDMVVHPDFGPGKVVRAFGGLSTVSFFGDAIDVEDDLLTLVSRAAPIVPDRTNEDYSHDKAAFRKAFEAINLGVAPPDCHQLIDLTIRSAELKSRASNWLANAPETGLCKAVFGYYGSGKSHLLQFVQCMALQAGWAVAYVEFDPKAADPAKPHLVYQNLMAALEFPAREDGRQAKGFMDFIKEVRDHWDSKSIRHDPVFRSNPWFSNTFEILMKFPHMPDVLENYRDACLWLAGNHSAFQTVNALAREKGLRNKVPRMPATKETADIYVHHLVVVNALCRLIGYKGLVIILDEAEHVRGYNVRRRERANNLFDLLARSAHLPDFDDIEPVMNDHGFQVPTYWCEGPHFGLLVGLTEGDTFRDPTLSLREACVFLRTEEDRVMLSNPSCDDYAQWAQLLLEKFTRFYPLQMQLLTSSKARVSIVECLAQIYPETPDGITLRNLTKLACLVPCIILAQPEITLDNLLIHLRTAAANYLGNELPWES